MAEFDARSEARRIWKMLDDMAAEDPEGYKKFIQSQMDAKKNMKPATEPHMVIETTVTLEGQKKPLYINVLEHRDIPAPESDADPLKIMGGEFYKAKYKDTEVNCLTIAFCSNVLRELGRDSASLVEQDQLINLAFDFIEDNRKVFIHRAYKILPDSQKYIGDLRTVRSNVSTAKPRDDTELLADLEDMLPDSDLSPAMLTKLAGLTTDDPPTLGEPPAAADLVRDHFLVKNFHQKDCRPRKKKLVEDITDKSALPEYSVLENDSGGVHKYLVRIRLPEDTRATDCDLDITKNSIKFIKTGDFELNIPLDKTVDFESASAKYSRRTGTLTLSVPIVKKT